MKTQQTEQQALTQVMNGVAEAIEVMGDRGIPSGHLYARMMGMGCTLEVYQHIIATLKDAGRITESGNVLRGVKQ